MSRIAFDNAAVRRADWRRRQAPAASILLASLTALLPIVAEAPLIPDIALLLLIAWRLLRPEIWSPMAALPLGLFDDLVSGQPLGQAMALWTATFIAFDVLDSRLLYRDYWMDWLAAAAAIAFCLLGGWAIARLGGSGAGIAVLLPVLAASILVFPLAARIVLAIDRWRLAR